MNRKVKCEECDWKGTDDELKRASNPWDINDFITGCPECNSVNSTHYVCDEPSCWRIVSCGTPTPNGYRSTCGEHQPK